MLQVMTAETKNDTVQFLREFCYQWILFFSFLFTAALKFNAHGGNPDFKWHDQMEEKIEIQKNP